MAHTSRAICHHGNLSIQPNNAFAPAMATVPVKKSRGLVRCAAPELQASTDNGRASVSRREALLCGVPALVGAIIASPALADFNADYKSETEAVIDRVKNTLALDKADPTKFDAVAVLRQTSNDWVAKYRREKGVAGRASFSNMYSVLNALSGHYISFGPNYPIPVKRKDRILEEIRDAEKALSRGR